MDSVALLASLSFGAPLTASAAATPHTVALQSMSNARIRGTATLTARGPTTTVAIALQNDPTGAVHPAHIHDGSCRHFDPFPRFALETVEHGKSLTVVHAPLHSLLGHGLVIEVHSSKFHVNIIAACGAL